MLFPNLGTILCGETGGGTPTPPNDGGNPSEPQKPTWTQEQQAEIDRIVTGRLARERETHTATLRQLLGAPDETDPLEEIRRLRTSANEDAQKREAQRLNDMKKSGDVDKIEAEWASKLKAENEARQTDKTKFQSELLKREARIVIGRIADKVHADALPLFAEKLEQALGVDETTFEVFPKDDNGRPLYDTAGNRVTVEGAATTLLDKHKYMLKAAGGGSGATQTLPGSKAPYDVVYERAKANPTADNLAALAAALPSGKEQAR